jgi:hypothetical protein
VHRPLRLFNERELLQPFVEQMRAGASFVVVGWAGVISILSSSFL